MAQTSKASISLDEIDRIVDTDAHLTERLDDLVPYIDETIFEPEKRTLENVQIPMTTVLSLGLAGPVRGKSYVSEETKAEQEGSDEDIEHFSAGPESKSSVKLREMADFGIDYGIVTPGSLLGIHTVNNPRLASAINNGYNNWLADNYLDVHEGLKACVSVSGHEPQRSAEEIDRMGEEADIVGVAFPSAGLVPAHGAFEYDPIYEAAEKHSLPIVVHNTTSTMGSDFPVQYKNTWTYAESYCVTHAWQQQWNVVHSMYKGFPERFPDLDILFQESGISWIPQIKWRMDDAYLEFPDDAPYLEKLPSEYLDDQYHFSTQPLGHATGNPEHMAQIIDMVGPESVLYASDLPHPTFDPPQELFQYIQGYFEEEEIRGMMGEYAADVFDL